MTNKKKAIIFQLLAVITVVIMTALVKLLSDTQTIVAIVFYQNSFALLCLFAYFIFTKKLYLVKTKKPYLHLKRSISGNIAMFLVFTAFSMLPMADMTALMLSVPLVATLLAVFLLGEAITIKKLAIILLGFIGVLFIAKPTGDVMLQGVLIAMIAILFVAWVSVLLRDIGKTEHTLTTIFYYFLSGGIITAFMMPFVFKPIHGIEFLFLFGCAVTALLNQLLKTEALRHADIATILPMNYTSIIWATMVGWLVWGDFPDWTVWVGGAIIIGSSFLSIQMDKKLKPV